MGMPHPKPEPRRKKNGHEYGCKCRPCIGSRNRSSGLKKQRQVAKQLGVQPKFVGQLGNEESWGLEHWSVECKSGKQIPKFITGAHRQAQSAQPIGSPKPVAVILVPEGVSPTMSPNLCFVVISLADFIGHMA